MNIIFVLSISRDPEGFREVQDLEAFLAAMPLQAQLPVGPVQLVQPVLPGRKVLPVLPALLAQLARMATSFSHQSNCKTEVNNK